MKLARKLRKTYFRKLNKGYRWMLLIGKFVNVFFFIYIFIFLIQQINQTLLSNGKHSLNHNSVPFVKKGLVFLITYSSIVLLGIPFGMYPWTWHLTTTRVLPKLVHWQNFWLQTSLSQGVTIHKTKITCIRPINIIPESIVICWDQK